MSRVFGAYRLGGLCTEREVPAGTDSGVSAGACCDESRVLFGNA